MGPFVDADEQFNVGLSVGTQVECIKMRTLTHLFT